MKKIIIAPDSFKGSLTSRQVIDIVARQAWRAFESVEIYEIAVADGGEGTVQALCPDGQKTWMVTGPLGEKVEATYGADGKTAVLEMAAASGLPLVDPLCRNPLLTSTFGTGELIAKALEEGFDRIVIGIGGSATNDGGMGALRALGVRFYDKDGIELSGCGQDLGKVARIDKSGLNKRLAGSRLRVMCDVTNPLTGPNGATHIYGPQKGADEAMIQTLEAGMLSYERVLQETFGVDTTLPGAGAAGGLGAALLAVGGELVRGIDAVLDLKGFDEKLCGCDLVVTGEGRFDSQSLGFGKVISGILTRCEKKGVPVMVLAGSVLGGCEELIRRGGSAIACVDRPMELREAMQNAAQALENAAARAFAFVKMGNR